MVYALGGYYDGEWRDGHQNGQGTSKNVHGHHYTGQFKNDMWHGKGKVIYAKQAGTSSSGSYDGEWQENKRHGIGKELYPNGDVYQGSFAND